MLTNQSPGQHSPRVAHQVVEQGVFLGGQLDLFAASEDRSPRRVEDQIGDLQHRRFRLGPSPEQSPHSGDQFLEGKGLGQVVVGAGIQPQDFIFDGGPHREQ